MVTPVPPSLPPASAISFGNDEQVGPLGRSEARRFTPPLRELTPDTSYGFDVIEFAEDIGRPLLEWQKWAVIHMGELLPNGCPRFRKLLMIVGRQSGKTDLLSVLALFWLFNDQIENILCTSTKLAQARKAWMKSVKLARKSEYSDEIANIRTTNGQEEIVTVDECTYAIAASNAEGGRGDSLGRLIMDELCRQHTYEAWSAAVPAMNAILDAQLVCITSQGDDRSIVLNDLHTAATTFLDTGVGDYRLGLLEWSCEPDADPLDLDALAQSNPNMNREHGARGADLLADAKVAVAAGGQALASFKTEVMGIRVRSMNGAINPDRWRTSADRAAVAAARGPWVLAVDVAPDFHHVALVAAAVQPDGRTALRVLGKWSGPKATTEFRVALPGLLRGIRPRSIGWLPQGPSATLAADLRRFIVTTKGDKPVRRLHGVRVEEIASEVAGVCMSFAEQVDAGRIVHPDDAMLTAHALAAERMTAGDGWRFARALEGDMTPVDGAYAAALAVRLARSAPASLGPVQVVVAD